MKRTLEELQFAASVRNLVRQRMDAAVLDMTEEEAAEFRNQPRNDMILEVLKELDAIAGVIAKQREAAPQQ